MLLKSILIAVIAAYFIGSIPSAIWVGYLFSGKDVRNSGSGNAGATNVYRLLGLGPGIVVFFLDAGKGAVVVWLCREWGLSSPWMIVAVLFLMLGHIYPVLAGFSGGKGISTAAGVLTLVNPLALAIALVSFGLIVWRFRLVSAASMTAAFIAFLTALVQFLFFSENWASPCVTGLLLILILFSHRSNILRLKSGRELRI